MRIKIECSPKERPILSSVDLVNIYITRQKGVCRGSWSEEPVSVKQGRYLGSRRQWAQSKYVATSRAEAPLAGGRRQWPRWGQRASERCRAQGRAQGTPSRAGGVALRGTELCAQPQRSPPGESLALTFCLTRPEQRGQEPLSLLELGGAGLVLFQAATFVVVCHSNPRTGTGILIYFQKYTQLLEPFMDWDYLLEMLLCRQWDFPFVRESAWDFVFFPDHQLPVPRWVTGYGVRRHGFQSPRARVQIPALPLPRPTNQLTFLV